MSFYKRTVQCVITLTLSAYTFSSVAEQQTPSIHPYWERLLANKTIKQYSSSITDGISSSSLGDFPDTNIVDALQRVTGVAISRDFGEGEKLAIRGTAPSWNRTFLNGQNIATADWFILDTPSRSFNYLLMPSDLIQSVQVIKTPDASMDEGSIGGSVMINTQKPLSLMNPTVVAQIETQYSTLSDETDPALSLVGAWQSPDHTFGFIMSGFFQERNVRRDGFEILGYETVTLDLQDYKMPSLLGSAYFEQERKRESFFASFEFKPNYKHDLTVNILYSDFSADNSNHNLLAVPTWEFSRAPSPVIDAYQVEKGVVVSMDYGEADREGAVLDAIARESSSQTESYDISYQFTLENDNELSLQLGYTEAQGGTTRDTFTEWSVDSRQSFDISDRVPVVSFADADITDGNAFDLDWTHQNAKPHSDREVYFQADFTQFLQDAFFTTVEYGLKFRDHSKSQQFYAKRIHITTDGYLEDLLSEIQGGGLTVGDIQQGSLPSDYMQDVAKSGSVTDYPLVDLEAFESAYWSQGDRITRFRVLEDFFDVDEDILAVYVKASFEALEGDLSGNMGLRVVETRVDSKAFLWDGPWWSPLNVREHSINTDYTDVLPSVNLSYQLSEEALIRFGLARVMARPDYEYLASSRNLNAATLTGFGGNPELDPFRANQLDLAYEWYFNQGGIDHFTIAFFYKDISSYIATDMVEETHLNELTSLPDTFAITLPRNGKGGSNQGVEIALTMDLTDTLGVMFNYTYSDAETDDGDLIEGNSKDTVNLGLFYNYGPFFTRLSYNYRSEYFEGIDRGSNLFTDSLEQLDIQISYQLTDQLLITFDGVNITGEPLYKYSDRQDTPYAFYDNGSRYALGLQLRF